MIIVITLSTAAMCLNHLVLPFTSPMCSRISIAGYCGCAVCCWRAFCFFGLQLLHGYGAGAGSKPLGYFGLCCRHAILPGVLGLCTGRAQSQRFSLRVNRWYSGVAVLHAAAAVGVAFSIEFPVPIPATDESNWHLAALAALSTTCSFFVWSA